MFHNYIIRPNIGRFFQGTQAHENMIEGAHNDSLAVGFANVLIYSTPPNDFVASATCNIEAHDPPAPDEHITGMYDIFAQASDNPQGEGDPPDRVTWFISGDLFDWVSAQKTQPNVAQGLWGMASGNAEVLHYLVIRVQGEFRVVKLFHRHSSPENHWFDYDLGI